jgi:hypothetical protein
VLLIFPINRRNNIIWWALSATSSTGSRRFQRCAKCFINGLWRWGMHDDFHIRQELVNTRDTRFLFQQTYVIDAPNAMGDGFTASDVGFKIFLFWTVSFTDGTEQTYLAIVHLKRDPCEEHGWDYHQNTDTTCVDFDFWTYTCKKALSLGLT